MPGAAWYIASKPDFSEAVRRMMAENEILGVKEKAPGFIFEKLIDVKELRLDYNIALLSPSRYFLPPRDSLIKFNLGSKSYRAAGADTKPSIILGIHPYDMHSVRTLDAVFSSGLPDANYLARRKSTLIIGIDCLNPWPYSFAASIGTAMPPKLFDLWLSDLGGDYLIESGSVRGGSLLKRYFDTRAASEAEIEQRESQRLESIKRYRLSLDMTQEEIPAVLDKGWSSPMWAELGEKCFSCGSCTMVCPTCVCFDVRDKTDLGLQGGERYRCWDSCMFFGFARIAGGEDFRPTGTDRLRHRLHRKGKYMLERWGVPGCVGCGRCVHACLVDIASPVYAYNRLAEEAK
jgi:formate hydrogenlyase subunit 6/NADH:ubiquinone oxidoreductase subunit I